eukprot:CAMPEP_0173418752 /NCGR_PEP_ID=MMETSP1357-20121228/816_1 /TAXON_ID=77926 /ORGANISM="Hemiselmis rufescens, Strain PCC563" /LENGTH=188 /DNA_ID=CAMNT_0014381293 /DNA_START=22 /DNA_END=587 /DNA_ORIENTATION=-
MTLLIDQDVKPKALGPKPCLPTAWETPHRPACLPDLAQDMRIGARAAHRLPPAGSWPVALSILLLPNHAPTPLLRSLPCLAHGRVGCFRFALIAPMAELCAVAARGHAACQGKGSEVGHRKPQEQPQLVEENPEQEKKEYSMSHANFFVGSPTAAHKLLCRTLLDALGAYPALHPRRCQERVRLMLGA